MPSGAPAAVVTVAAVNPAASRRMRPPAAAPSAGQDHPADTQTAKPFCARSRFVNAMFDGAVFGTGLRKLVADFVDLAFFGRDIDPFAKWIACGVLNGPDVHPKVFLRVWIGSGDDFAVAPY